MFTLALRCILAGALVLAVRLPAQVFEVGDDGTIRDAPGLGPSKVAPPGLDEGQPSPRRPTSRTSARAEWVVQLGAYPSRALLDADWQRISERHADLLAAYSMAMAEVLVAGRRHIRLSVTGLEDRQAALQLCEQLHAQGTGCFVRRAEPLAASQRQ